MYPAQYSSAQREGAHIFCKSTTLHGGLREDKINMMINFEST